MAGKDVKYMESDIDKVNDTQDSYIGKFKWYTCWISATAAVGDSLHDFLIAFLHHYENTPIQIHVCRKFHLQKLTIFSIKNSDIFHISAQNIDCGYSLEPPRRGGSNKYPQYMFLCRNKKNNEYPVNSSFTI